MKIPKESDYSNKEISKRSRSNVERSPPSPIISFTHHLWLDNPSNNQIHTRNHPYHYALIFISLTTYRHKIENRNPKKNPPCKTTFL